MSSTLPLASSIAAMDRGALEALVQRRRLQAPGGVSDPIGLASELLRTDSIVRALGLLERGDLAALLRFGTEADGQPCPRGDGSPDAGRIRNLMRLGLVGADGGHPARLTEVSEALRSMLEAHGIEDEELAHGPAAAPKPAAEAEAPADTSAWFAAALAEAGRAAAMLRTLSEQPGRLNRDGAVSAAAVRQLAETVGTDPEHAARTLVSLECAALTVGDLEAQRLSASAEAAHWLAEGQAERWCALASARLDATHEPLRRVLSESGGESLLAALDRRFPLLPDALRAEAEGFALAAEDLGLAVGGRLSVAARLLLDGDEAGALAAAKADMPGTVPGVYVQPDLSVVVPGPLAPDDEAALAALARPEQLGVASTLRVTEASLSAAFERGVTAADARAVFERLSLTGVPQPLAYLIDSLAERFGDIVVGEHTGDEGRTRISVAQPELLETLLVDRSLQHLQLSRGSDPSSPQLFSRLRAEHVLAALGDARYPATPEHLEAPAAPPAARRPRPGGLSPELAALVDRVHAAASAEPGTADFTRLIELAIRDRSPVRVTAEARGESRDFTLVPVSLSGGRMRALDQTAGVERTLPTASITAIAPA